MSKGYYINMKLIMSYGLSYGGEFMSARHKNELYVCSDIFLSCLGKSFLKLESTVAFQF